jgi:hypothetical protein
MTKNTRTTTPSPLFSEKGPNNNDTPEAHGSIGGWKSRRTNLQEPLVLWRPTISPQVTMVIIVRSLGRGRFAPLINGRALHASATPLLSAARVLQAKGVPDDTSLEMIHEGSTVVALRSTVGKAARLRVNETGGTPRFVPWRPDQLPSMGSSLVPLRGQTDKRALSGGSTLDQK